MIEILVLNYLQDKTFLKCYMEVPENPPEEYIVIEKTGSASENCVYSATLAIQSCAASLYRAAEINELVKAVMDDIYILDDVYSADLNSDYNFTDTSTKTYRYQAVYDIYY